MKRSRVFGLLAILLGGGLLVGMWAWHAWRYRHMPDDAEINGLIAQTQPLVDQIEALRSADGVYPASLDRASVGMVDSLGEQLRYQCLANGTDYELVVPHSRWVSSFNGLVYSPDAQFRAVWQDLPHKRDGRWMYVIGAGSAW